MVRFTNYNDVNSFSHAVIRTAAISKSIDCRSSLRCLGDTLGIWVTWKWTHFAWWLVFFWKKKIALQKEEVLCWSCLKKKKIRGGIRHSCWLLLPRWVKSLCVAMGIVTWRFWLECMDSPYVIFMASSTDAKVVCRGTARRPWLLKKQSFHTSKQCSHLSGQGSHFQIWHHLDCKTSRKQQEWGADKARCGPVAIN